MDKNILSKPNELDNIKQNIMQKGYHIIPGYLNKKKCSEIIYNMNGLLHSNNGFVHANSGIKEFTTGGDYRSPEFNKFDNNAKMFLDDKNLHNIFEQLYNRKIVKKRCQAGVVFHFDGIKNSSGGGWHVDNYDLQLKAMIYLTDVKSNNGPFTYINNTNNFARKKNPDLKNHRFSDDIINNELILKNNANNGSNNDGNEFKIEELTGNAGDCILFRSDNIHKGKIIESGVRYSLTNYYY